MAIGYDSPLYVLPFDHRATFSKTMFGWEGPLGPEQTAQIAAVKEVIYDAFKAAVAGGVPKERAGILVDEQFGAAILRDASKQGYITACPAEKSGQDEFDFEYGEDFAGHIEEFNPTFCKVLVRYNPEGDKDLNRRQAARLKQLSDYLHTSGRLYMFELLVPADAGPAAAARRRQEGVRPPAAPRADGAGHPRAAGRRRRGGRLEDRGHRTARRTARRSSTAARRGGRDKVGCIILGRGEDDEKVRQWLSDRRGGAGVHRLRGRPDHLLGSARGLPRRPDHAGRGRRANRRVLPRVGGSLRAGEVTGRGVDRGGPRPA